MTRRERRRLRVLDTLARYPGVEFYGGDLARMAYASLIDVQMMDLRGEGITSRPDPHGTPRRMYRLADREVPA